jgi:hypothetical protein
MEPARGSVPVNVTTAVRGALDLYTRAGRWDTCAWDDVPYGSLLVRRSASEQQHLEWCFCADEVVSLDFQELPGGAVEHQGVLDICIDENGDFLGWRSMSGRSVQVPTDFVSLWRVACNLADVDGSAICERVKGILLRHEDEDAVDAAFQPWMLDAMGPEDWELLQGDYPKLRRLTSADKLRLTLVYRAAVRNILLRSCVPGSTAGVAVVAESECEQGEFGLDLERRRSMVARLVNRVQVVGCEYSLRATTFEGRNDLGFADMFLSSAMPGAVDWLVLSPSAPVSLAAEPATKRRQCEEEEEAHSDVDMDGGPRRSNAQGQDRKEKAVRRARALKRGVGEIAERLRELPPIDCSAMDSVAIHQPAAAVIATLESAASGTDWKDLLDLFKAGMRPRH